jgi:hypothetical protein
MNSAVYEYKQPFPAILNALLIGLFGSIIAMVVTALIPASGWSSASEAPIALWGYEVFVKAWSNHRLGYAISQMQDDLAGEFLLRLCAVGLSGVVCAIVGYRFAYAATPLTDCREHYDGPRLMLGRHAVKSGAAEMAELRTVGEAPIELAPDVPYPRLWRVLNLLIVGAIGSGKTRLILYFLEQIITQIYAPRQTVHSLLVHDTTGEILDGLPLKDGTFAALHPHRTGGWGWAMGHDLVTIEDIEEAADQAISSTREAMWSRGASSIAAGCMLIAREDNGPNWGMPEFYAAAMLSPLEMKARFLDVYPLAAQLIEFDESGELSKTSVGMLLTFRASVLRTLRPLAQAWANLPRERMFSFSDWVRQAGRQPLTVVLQRSGQHPTMSSLWIGMVLDTIVSHVGGDAVKVEQDRTRTLVLDELPALGKLRRLAELLDIGRNKGLCTIAAVQDLAQLDRLYGEHAKSLKSRFRLKIFGAQTRGPELKEIAEKEIGMRRVLDRSYPRTITTGPQGRTVQVTQQERVDTVPVVPEHHLAHHLGVRGKKVSAILTGLRNPVQLDWPMTVWKKRR